MGTLNRAPKGGNLAAMRERKKIFDERKMRVARVLYERGPMSLFALAQACGVPDSTVHILLAGEWFESQQYGYRLTTAGHQAVRGM